MPEKKIQSIQSFQPNKKLNKFSKKGISPLIATVLLIGFTVALAAVIMTWGLDYVKSTTKKTEETTREALRCATDLNFEISEVNCADNKVTIDNRGDVEIVNITFRIFSGDDGRTEVQPGLGPFGIKSITLDNPLSGASRVEAIATIKGESGSKDITCGSSIREYILSC